MRMRRKKAQDTEHMIDSKNYDTEFSAIRLKNLKANMN